jgi:hypothetical protein
MGKLDVILACDGMMGDERILGGWSEFLNAC